MRFIPIDEKEYWKVRKEVEEGTCDYESNIEPGVFRIRDYLDRLKEMENK